MPCQRNRRYTINGFYSAVPALVAAIVAAAMTPMAMRLAQRIGALDRPGPRKVHLAPIPRLGGVAVVGGVIAAWLALYGLSIALPLEVPPNVSSAALVALLPIFIVSIVDDARSVRMPIKLAAHVLAASLAVSFGIVLPPVVHVAGIPVVLGPAAVPLSLLWIVGVTNAFNLADGLDGLSAGLGLISATCLMILGAHTGGAQNALAASAVVGALIGFMPFNVYPAKVFLGDTGATAVGFLLSCISLTSAARLSSGLAVLVPVLVMGVPIAEALISIVRRIVRRTSRRASSGIFQPDSDHFHHRLLALGHPHQRATQILWLAGLIPAALGLLSMFVTARSSAFLLVALIAAAAAAVQRLGYDEFALVRRGVLLRIYDYPVLKLNQFRLFVDLAVVSLCLYVAVGLRFEGWSLRDYRIHALDVLPTLSLTTAAVFALMGLYRRSWSTVSTADVVRVAAAVVGATLLAAGALAMITPGTGATQLLSVYAPVSVVVFAGLRSSYHLLNEYRLGHNSGAGMATLLYGAGRGGQMAVQELRWNPALGLHPTAFIDDAPSKRGKYLHGLEVIGSIDDIADAARARRIRAVVITTPAITGATLARLTAICEPLAIGVFQLVVRVDTVMAGTEWPLDDQRPQFSPGAVTTVPSSLVRS